MNIKSTILFLCALSVAVHGATRIKLADFDIKNHPWRTVATFKPDGAGLVVDRIDKNIVFFTADGRVIKTSGSQGKIAGQFINPDGAWWIQEESLFVVRDTGRLVLSLWDELGNFVQEIPLPESAGGLTSVGFPAKGVYIIGQFLYGGHGKKPQLVRLEGTQSRAIWSHTPGELVHNMTTTKGGPGFLPSPWDPKLRFGCGSDFIAVGFGDSPDIELIDFEGKPLGKISTGLQREALTQAQTDAFLELAKERAAIYQRGFVRPESWPFYKDILVDGADRIWVFCHDLIKTRPYHFRVFDREGRLLRQGNMKSLPVDILAKSIVHYQRDEDGTEWLVSSPLPFQ